MTFGVTTYGTAPYGAITAPPNRFPLTMTVTGNTAHALTPTASNAHNLNVIGTTEHTLIVTSRGG